jgi:hypothetical protein
MKTTKLRTIVCVFLFFLFVCLFVVVWLERTTKLTVKSTDNSHRKGKYTFPSGATYEGDWIDGHVRFFLSLSFSLIFVL